MSQRAARAIALARRATHPSTPAPEAATAAMLLARIIAEHPELLTQRIAAPTEEDLAGVEWAAFWEEVRRRNEGDWAASTVADMPDDDFETRAREAKSREAHQPPEPDPEELRRRAREASYRARARHR